MGRALVSELDLESVLERVLGVARELTGAHYAALGILDERREALERFITQGIDPATRRRIGDLPRGRGVLGLLIDDPRPLRLSDVGHHPRSYGFPSDHPPMHSFLGVPILIRGEVYGNLYLTEKDAGEFDEADEQAAIVLAEWAAIAIDNARLYAGVERRRAELERAVHSLEATTEIARAVGGETDLSRVLETIVKRGRALVDARSMLILLRDDEDLVVAATAGEFEDDPRDRRFPASGSTSGEVLRTLRAERLPDVASRLRLSAEDLGVEASAGLLVPLAFRGRPLGVLIAFDRLVQGPEFDAEDERLLHSFAASAAMAVATAKSVAEDRLRHSLDATEQERARWARELHDETLQGLGALRVLLTSGLQLGPDRLEEAVREAIDELGSSIANLRGIVAELRPAALDEIGLAAAVSSLAERSGAVGGLQVEAEISLESARPAELDSAIYRIVQEGLTNVVKHARAEHVRLKVVERDDAIEVLLEDDGVGFDPGEPHEGFGLVSIRERVQLAAGSVTIDSSPGSGTRIEAHLSLPAEMRPQRSATG